MGDLNCQSGFKRGDLVFAKIKGYSPWPAKVLSRIQNRKSEAYKVKFYGPSKSTGIAHGTCIYSYNEDNIAKYGQRRSDIKINGASFNKSLDEIEGAASSTVKVLQSTKKEPAESYKVPSTFQRKRRATSLPEPKNLWKRASLEQEDCPPFDSPFLINNEASIEDSTTGTEAMTPLALGSTHEFSEVRRSTRRRLQSRRLQALCSEEPAQFVLARSPNQQEIKVTPVRSKSCLKSGKHVERLVQPEGGETSNATKADSSTNKSWPAKKAEDAVDPKSVTKMKVRNSSLSPDICAPIFYPRRPLPVLKSAQGNRRASKNETKVKELPVLHPAPGVDEKIVIGAGATPAPPGTKSQAIVNVKDDDLTGTPPSLESRENLDDRFAAVIQEVIDISGPDEAKRALITETQEDPHVFVAAINERELSNNYEAEVESPLKELKVAEDPSVPQEACFREPAFNETLAFQGMAAAIEDNKGGIREIDEFIANNLGLEAPKEMPKLKTFDANVEMSQDNKNWLNGLLAQNNLLEFKGSTDGSNLLTELVQVKREAVIKELHAINILRQIMSCLGEREVDAARAIVLLEELESFVPKLSTLDLTRNSDIVTIVARLTTYMGNNKLWGLEGDELNQFQQLAAKIREIATRMCKYFATVFWQQKGDLETVSFEQLGKDESKAFQERTSGLSASEVDDLMEINGEERSFPTRELVLQLTNRQSDPLSLQ